MASSTVTSEQAQACSRAAIICLQIIKDIASSSSRHTQD
jgi:hypothetical protein